jgi:hypothetical protein
MQLLAGGEYGWNVEAAHAAAGQRPVASPAYFRVVAPAEVAALRAACARTGDAWLDALLVAAALLAHDLAADAVNELEQTPRLDPPFEHLRRVLLVQAARRLEDVVRVSAQATDAPAGSR